MSTVSSSTSHPHYVLPQIDVFFGKLKRSDESKRIRTRTGDETNKNNSSSGDTVNDNSKSNDTTSTQTLSSSSGGVLGFFRNSFSKNADNNSNFESSKQQQQNSGNKRKQKRKNPNKVRPQLDDDVDLTKFPESALYNSLHIEKLKAEVANETTINAVAEEAPLRKELWHGVVEQPLLRAECWRITLGISPATYSRRIRDAQRQVLEYRDYLKLYYYCHQPTTSSSSSKPPSARHSRQPSQSSTNSATLPLSSPLEGNLPSCLFPSVDSPTPHIDKRTKTERDILNQLAIDLPRHKAALYFTPQLIERLRRCLYIWALRNPAVGYVQGMDDVVVVMMIAFLDEAFSMLEPWNQMIEKLYYLASNNSSKNEKGDHNNNQDEDEDEFATKIEEFLHSTYSPAEQLKMWLTLRQDLKGVSKPNTKYVDGCRPWTQDLEDLEDMIAFLPPCALDIVECDTYNCGGRFLSWGMDRYTFGQPGVISTVDKISTGLKQFDPELHHYLREVCHVEFRTFAYKYVHLLMVRDFGQWLSMRLFDSLLSAGSSQCWELFSCICVAWLISVRKKILTQVPQDEILMFLQDPAKLGMGGNVSNTSANGSLEGKSALRWMEDLLSRAYLLMLQKKQQQMPTMMMKK